MNHPCPMRIKPGRARAQTSALAPELSPSSQEPIYFVLAYKLVWAFGLARSFRSGYSRF
jgi:hypothetical protein